jgi:hypothetical protein
VLERTRLVQRSHPPPALDLLLQAGIGPEEQAVRAWMRWNEVRSFETLSPAEKQLIAVFAKRIVELGPASPLRPRIEGLARNLWAATEVALGQAVDGLHHLGQAGIPFILLNGGALHAEGFAAPWRPPAGDVAILVGHDATQPAADALAGAGWLATGARTASERRRLLERGSGLVYRNGQQGRIHLHTTARFGLCPGSGDAVHAIWLGARPATLRSLAVLVPDPADAILIDLTSAPLAGQAAWAHRIGARIAHQQIDWDKLTDAAGRHGLVLSCLGGLGYMRDVLAVPIPDTALVFLRTAPLDGTAWLRYLAHERDPGDRRLLPRAMAFAARRLLRHHGRRTARWGTPGAKSVEDPRPG